MLKDLGEAGIEHYHQLITDLAPDSRTGGEAYPHFLVEKFDFSDLKISLSRHSRWKVRLSYVWKLLSMKCHDGYATCRTDRLLCNNFGLYAIGINDNISVIQGTPGNLYFRADLAFRAVFL